jgi:hypothetical protein
MTIHPHNNKGIFMKINAGKALLALCIAFSLASITTAADAYCRYVPAHHYHGRFIPQHRVCYHNNHYNNYHHRCWWRNGVKVCR